ncbi:hypothetical protein LUW77_01435 [Streptomyces radiopugnans]|nr:hypothetical protein LUW77_01435 [Streptomyces radiopugnans]
MEIMAADLFRHRTIAELAAVVDQRREGEETASDGLLPLSPFQREIFARSAPEVPTAVQQFTIPVDPSFAPDTAVAASSPCCSVGTRGCACGSSRARTAGARPTPAGRSSRPRRRRTYR